MKAQKFYPSQVLRALQGNHQRLDAGQHAALMFAMLRGRKLGLALAFGPALTRQDYEAAALGGPMAVQAMQQGAPLQVRIFGSGSRRDGFPARPPKRWPGDLTESSR